MASLTPLSLLLFTFFAASLVTNSVSVPSMFPSPCTKFLAGCTASLYHINTGLHLKDIASFYSVRESQITPITHGSTQDYLISVPSSCQDDNGTSAYFYSTKYTVQEGDTFVNISNVIYSGQAWNDGGDGFLVPGANITIYLLTGCTQGSAQTVVTYTVQQDDTLSSIATLLNSTTGAIESMNKQLITNPGIIEQGWVLYVPTQKSSFRLGK